MMLLEHDAKELLGAMGLPIPTGSLVTGENAGSAILLPVVVKAQVPVGGRGKAGGIRLARTLADRDAAIREIIGMTIKGHEVRAVRLEETVSYVAEAYISFTVDASSAKVRILVSPHGGVDVEDEASRGDLLSGEAALDAAAMAAVVDALGAKLPPELATPVREAGHALIAPFLAYDAMLIEINPLFILSNGSWVIGDTKLVADDNAFARDHIVRDRVASQPLLYPQVAIKLDQDYDFVRLDPRGDIGLVTTGAGLSMQLIDELVARGFSPFNFCDIRTGMFRGDPARLIQVLQWLAAAPDLKVVLVNFFAGLTDLAEIAGLLLTALKAVPELKVPVVARLIGNNLDAALKVIADAGNPISVETDLELAIARASAVMQK